MRRWARAAPAILAGALVAITTASATTAAPPRAGAATNASASASASASGSDLQLTPVGATGAAAGAGIAFAVDPGATVKRTVVVANRSTTLRMTVRLAGVDATMRAGGAVHYATDAAAGGPATWLTLSDVVTTLEPGANVRVALSITPPGNADPGAVTAGLVARVDHAANAADNRSVDAPAEVTMPVAITVKGAPTALVSIASVKAVEDGGHDALAITFQNSGATPATMSGQVRVAGASPHADPVHVTIPPLTHTDIRVPFTKPSDGKGVAVQVSAKDARGNEATWGGKVGASTPTPAPAASTPRTADAATQDASASHGGGTSLPLPALVGVGLVFLAAAVWFALEMRRSRAGKRVKPVVGAPVVPGVPAAVAVAAAPAVDGTTMGAVAEQLAALVGSIDRLASRLGEVAVPVAGAPAASASPSPPQFSERSDEPVPANPAPMFYAPATQRGPAAEFDPYDWPTQEQLDNFVARRRAPQSDL